MRNHLFHTLFAAGLTAALLAIGTAGQAQTVAVVKTGAGNDSLKTAPYTVIVIQPATIKTADGKLTLSTKTPEYTAYVDGVLVNDLSTVDPSTIASMDVKKGGASGTVIEITTKGNAAGKAAAAAPTVIPVKPKP